MYTYFISNKVNSLVKIGKSINVERRIKQIEGQCNFLELSVMHVIEGNYEADFHLFYKEFRKKGEWFDIPDLTIDKIEADFKKIRFIDTAEENEKDDLHKMIDSMIEYLSADFSIESFKRWAIDNITDDDITKENEVAVYGGVDLDMVYFELAKMTLVFKKGLPPITIPICLNAPYDGRISIFGTPDANGDIKCISKAIRIEDY